MRHTDTSRHGLETLIVATMTGQAGSAGAAPEVGESTLEGGEEVGAGEGLRLALEVYLAVFVHFAVCRPHLLVGRDRSHRSGSVHPALPYHRERLAIPWAYQLGAARRP